MEKLCPKCGKVKPLTEDYFYRARPRKNHMKEESWQSFCKECWKTVNADNKARRKSDAGNQVQRPGWTPTPILFLHEGPEGILCSMPKDPMPVSPKPTPALVPKV